MLFLIVTIGGGIVVPSLLLDIQRTSLASTSGSIGADSIDPYESSEGIQADRVGVLSEYARNGFIYEDYGQEREPFSTEISEEEAYQAANGLAEIFIMNNVEFGIDKKVNSVNYAAINSLAHDPTLALWLFLYEGDVVCVDTLTGIPIYAQWSYPYEVLPVSIRQPEGFSYVEELLDSIAVDILELTDSSDYPNEFIPTSYEVEGDNVYRVNLTVRSKLYTFHLIATILDENDLAAIEFTTSTQVDEN